LSGRRDKGQKKKILAFPKVEGSNNGGGVGVWRADGKGVERCIATNKRGNAGRELTEIGVKKDQKKFWTEGCQTTYRRAAGVAKKGTKKQSLERTITRGPLGMVAMANPDGR